MVTPVLSVNQLNVTIYNWGTRWWRYITAPDMDVQMAVQSQL